MAENRLSWTPQPANTVGDLLHSRGPRQLTTVSPDATVAAAVELMQGTGISQLPVLRDGSPVGSIQEVTLARILHDGGDPAAVRVQEVMARPLPQLEVGTQLDEAYRLLLAGNTGILAVSDGAVLDIITRIDLVQYWNQRPRP
jgi:cystathionine beta-synthase